MPPKISVIIASYNRANYLPEAIQSVQDQSFKDWELVVIDDGSTDNTKELVKNFCLLDGRIKYFANEKNLGICATRDHGLKESQGEFVAILDSDDAWCDKDKLQIQYDFLTKNIDYALVGGGVVLVDKHGVERGGYLNNISSTSIYKTILIKNPFAHSTVMYRRDSALKVGGYGQTFDGVDLNAIEDYNLWMKLGQLGKMTNIGKYFVNYRLHDDNISIVKRLSLMERNIILIKKYKNNYPNFHIAYCRRMIRYWMYCLYKKIF